MFAFKLCRDFGSPFIHPDHITACLTAEQFNDWLRAYDQDPWGEEREDLRRMAYEMLADPSAEVKPVYPYFENDDDLIEQNDELAKRREAIDPEIVAAKFAKAREEHYKKHPKRG